MTAVSAEQYHQLSVCCNPKREATLGKLLHQGFPRLTLGARRLTCSGIAVMSSWPSLWDCRTLAQARAGKAFFLLAPRAHFSFSGRLTHRKGYRRQNMQWGDEIRSGVHSASHHIRSASSSMGLHEKSDAIFPAETELAGGVREGEHPRRPWTCLGLQRHARCDE